MNLVKAHRLWALMLAVAAVLPAARGVWMNVPSGGTKCVSEKLYNNVVVMADYYSFYGENDDVNNTITPSINVKVSSPYGNVLHSKEKISHGGFAFTTTESGDYHACFSVDSSNGKTVTVGLDWRIGIAAKNWDSIAKKEKIEGLDLELKKLEDVTEAIHKNMYRLMEREMEMRKLSNKTNGRVARYSIMSLGVCIVVSILQICYLRRYFQKKKLI